jgi:hypothetical protein
MKYMKKYDSIMTKEQIQDAKNEYEKLVKTSFLNLYLECNLKHYLIYTPDKIKQTLSNCKLYNKNDL